MDLKSDSDGFENRFGTREEKARGGLNEAARPSQLSIPTTSPIPLGDLLHSAGSTRGRYGFDKEESLTALWKGSFLLKHGRQGKPKVHYFRLSQDCREISWTRSSGTTRSIDLLWVHDVLLGQVTGSFQKRPVHADAASFSVMYCRPSLTGGSHLSGDQQRTLDLTFMNTMQRDVWYHGLVEAVRYCHALYNDGDRQPDQLCADAIGDFFIWGNIGMRKPNVVSQGIEAMMPNVGFGDCWPQSSMPVMVPCNNLIDIQKVSIGHRHTVIASKYGNVYTFGEGKGGKLGLGHFEDAKCPQKLQHGFELSAMKAGIVDICCGDEVSSLLTEDGDMFLWGKAGPGLPPSSIPIPWNIGPLTGVRIISIACGPYHCAAIAGEGKLFTWGEGLGGKLGLGDVKSRSQPTNVASLNGKVIDVACGTWHSAAIVVPDEDPSLKRPTHQRTPSGIGSLFGTVVTPDAMVACYREGNGGYLYTWGGVNENVVFGDGKGSSDSNKGCLGHGESDIFTGQFLPKLVRGALEGGCVRRVEAGAHLTIALTTSGNVYQMGATGASCGAIPSPWEGALSPLCVRGNLSGIFVDKIACGMHHALVAGRTIDKRSGKPLDSTTNLVFAWGRGTEGQLGTGKLEDSKCPIPLETFKGRSILDISCGGVTSGVVCAHDARRNVLDFTKGLWDAASRILVGMLVQSQPASRDIKLGRLSLKKSIKFRDDVQDEAKSLSRYSLSSRGSTGYELGFSRPTRSIVSVNENSQSGEHSTGTVRRSIGQFASQHSNVSLTDVESASSFGQQSSRSGVHAQIQPSPQSQSTLNQKVNISSDYMIPSRWRHRGNKQKASNALRHEKKEEEGVLLTHTLAEQKAALEAQKKALATWEAHLREKEDALADHTTSPFQEEQTVRAAETGADDNTSWTEELENGVTATYTSIKGTPEPKLMRIRFSRSLFTPEDAAKWYEENQDKVLQAGSSSPMSPAGQSCMREQPTLDDDSKHPNKTTIHGRLNSRNMSFDVRELIQFHSSIRSPQGMPSGSPLSPSKECFSPKPSPFQEDHSKKMTYMNTYDDKMDHQPGEDEENTVWHSPMQEVRTERQSSVGEAELRPVIEDASTRKNPSDISSFPVIMSPTLSATSPTTSASLLGTMVNQIHNFLPFTPPSKNSKEEEDGEKEEGL